ncbi:PIR protein CIR protein [Plasmodium vinckei petteri]|uniref:PIR protein CIR protein n=1 Tax=Plasmodium vinckei petteri TaxID=138298 RepID=A0A6V7TA64_PLAVN|nr:PIR protein CIR protein [Plasmodium vinckei petteri]
MSEKACKLFRDADAMFNGKFVDGGKFNDNYSLYNDYCPQDKNGAKKCNTDYEKISAVGGYLFMELMRSNNMNLNDDNDRYVQYFIIWLSHKLHKIAINNIAFLNQTYEENLGKSVGNFNFWNLINNQKKELKNSNIAIMNMFYILFNQICETINKYQTPGIQPHEYTNLAMQCNIIYDELSKFVNNCGPYLGILDHLKTVFDDFISTANDENIHGEHILDQLINLSSTDKTNAGSRLKSKQCRQVHQKLIKNPPSLIKKEIKRLKSAINRNLQKASNPEPSTLIVPQTQEGTALTNHPSGLDILAISSEGEDDDEEDDNADSGEEDDNADGDEEGGNADGGEGDGADDGEEDSDEDDENGDDAESTDGTGESDTQTDINSGLGNPQDKHDTQGSEQKGSTDGQVNQPTSSNPQIVNPESSGGGKENLNSVPEGSNGGLGNSGSGQGDTHKEPENSKSQQNDQSVTQEDSGSIEKLRNIFNSVQNKFESYRSSFYETSTNIGKRLYENVSSTLENAYNGSITFGKTIITNLNEKIEKTISNFIPSNDKPELQDPKNEPPSKDNLQNSPTLDNNPSEPNPPILPPPEPSPPILPPPEPSPPILSPTDPDPPPLPSKEPDPENNKVHNGQPQCKKNGEPTPQVINEGSQNSVDSMKSSLVKQKDPGTKVKGNKTGIGDIYILKEYKKIGISIIVILIPITLAIMYKYLSSGWRKEMRRKKNMKKVINSIGGKRTVQIIIKSVDTKKMTNSVINPVHREKKSLLNIYKLMQADPVPFINLFFLLIFFVYKRKLNYLEL